MLRIREIQLKNFRAFSGNTTTIPLHEGKNLIVFGENGSGKSSLFYALKNFFESVPKSLMITEHPYKNFFAQENAGVFIKLKFLPLPSLPAPSDPAVPLKLNYQWSNNLNESSQLARQGFDVTKGFIDYKDLLQTYFLQQEADTVNVFDFLLENVLEDVRVLDGSHTFGERWKAIKQLQANITEAQILLRQVQDKRTKAANALKARRLRDERDIRELLDLLNADLLATLPVLAAYSNDILSAFKMNTSIDLEYSLARYEGNGMYQRPAIKAKDIVLQVKYYDVRRPKHHQFLNEARLSAIAVSLYFASFLVNPQAGIKILVLDDLLIGLDMANRLPVLDILDQHFSDFQVFIFTFDKFWYQSLQYRFPSWEKIEFYPLKTSTDETPTIKYPHSFLIKAKTESRRNSYESAANFLRSFYEEIIKGFCSHCKLKVPFQLEPHRLNAVEFWKAILDDANSHKPSQNLISRVETVVKTILNPLSHAANVPMTSDEIRFAIDVIEELDDELKALKVQYEAT
jgi:ABC-type cobalamin/Fe3+-siderophores transport system ATPase subunit